ncbi:LacI family transcriptional regulator [Burkholderia metallica]|nr:LacI family transcriptional regulator [Burkholderia metallica]
MTRIFNPPHPGEALRDDVLPALGLSVTEAAAQLGVTRAALSRILHGHASISPEMALRLEAWLGEDNGGRADLWLAQQVAFDLWQARRRWRERRRAHDGAPAGFARRASGQYRLGSPAGRVLKRLWTQ